MGSLKINRKVAFILLLGMRAAVAQTTSKPFAPTGSPDQAAIDRIWQQSISKYDADRGKILQDVDKMNAAGPFRY